MPMLRRGSSVAEDDIFLSRQPFQAYRPARVQLVSGDCRFSARGTYS